MGAGNANKTATECDMATFRVVKTSDAGEEAANGAIVVRNNSRNIVRISSQGHTIAGKEAMVVPEIDAVLQEKIDAGLISVLGSPAKKAKPAAAKKNTDQVDEPSGNAGTVAADPDVKENPVASQDEKQNVEPQEPSL